MEFINLLIEFIGPFFSQIWGRFVQKESKPAPKPKIPMAAPDAVLDPAAFEIGKLDFLKNKKALIRGVPTFRRGDYEGKKFNDVMYAITKEKGCDPIYLKICRLINSKDGTKCINENVTNKLALYKTIKGKGKKQTWCNRAASCWSIAFGLGNISEWQTDLNQFSANGLIENLKNGIYINNGLTMKKCSLQNARDNAAAGGLSFITYRNHAGSGHIATFMPDGMLIQAGIHTGVMTVRQAFGLKLLGKCKYWRLAKV